ncbi:hypothetical protein GRF29_1g3636650 [Pseudopithomyces chartarum]|uniref:Uncharacterized protein n=1 Tax=Pseudopithomyces chartarum TaxID=1892770 RepID=A0AAN6MA17_9PLEO|nr:hypothetical protein GRF29_1g3636650 [Pseudopithomyces chartarum]
MRFSFATVVGLAGLAVAAPAPTAVREEQLDIASLLSGLLGTIQGHSASIQSILGPLGPLSSVQQKQTAVPHVADALGSIAKAISDVTSQVLSVIVPHEPGARAPEKREIEARMKPIDKRQLESITNIFTNIIGEIVSTVTGVIGKLGFGGLLPVNQVTGALSGLLLAVQKLPNIVLGTVTSLLSTVLAGLPLIGSGSL